MKYSPDSTYVTKVLYNYVDEKTAELIRFTFWHYPLKNITVPSDTFKSTKTILSKSLFMISSQNNTALSDKSFHWVNKNGSVYKSQYKKYRNGKLYSSFVQHSKYSRDKKTIKRVTKDKKSREKEYFNWNLQSVDIYGNQSETFVVRKDFQGKSSKKLLVYTREYY